MNLPVKTTAALLVVCLVSGCSAVGAKERPQTAGDAVAEQYGPAADYPMVLGEPFVIDGVTWRPEDRLNYDQVGLADIGADGGTGISVASKTLPLPSYVEVTSLNTGKTILARVERRGPMRNDRLIEFSPGAAAQLGVIGTATEPVRVRRVNPTEPERAALRAGQTAPMRMETPKSLVAVLVRKLQAQMGVQPAPAPQSAADPVESPRAAAVRNTARTKAPAVAAPAPRGSLFVQAAAFSTRDRANSAANALGGRVEAAGKLFRVRVGPFSSSAEAEAALAKVRGAGYSDARIQRGN